MKIRLGSNHWLGVAVAALGVAGTAPAGNIIGPLANFDVVNDTGQPAYGFEIEIEDPSFDHTKLTSIFGYDRVFSFISPDPGAVVKWPDQSNRPILRCQSWRPLPERAGPAPSSVPGLVRVISAGSWV